MHILCNLNITVIEKEFGKLNTAEVILTKERTEHIQSHHPLDYDLFLKHGVETITNPDIILRDMKNIDTIFLISKLPDTNLNTIVRLSISDKDDSNHKNSVMTFYRIRTKNLEKLLAKHKMLYIKEEFMI